MAETATAPLLGEKPPSSKFGDLVTVHQLKDTVERLYERASKEDLRRERSTLRQPKEALTELSNMIRIASNDVGKAAAALKKQREQSAKKRVAEPAAVAQPPVIRRTTSGSL